MKNTILISKYICINVLNGNFGSFNFYLYHICECAGY